MTQEDLRRDVERLERLREFISVGAFDRAIEVARIRASMSDEQRAYMRDRAEMLARAPHRAGMKADAWLKVALLMGAA